MKKYLKAFAIAGISISFAACSSTKKTVELSEFNHYVDSVSQTNGSEIFVEYNSFKNFEERGNVFKELVNRL